MRMLNLGAVVATFCITALVYYLIIKLIKSSLERLILFLFLLVHLIYAGLGIGLVQERQFHLIVFIIFTFVMGGSIAFTYYFIRKRAKQISPSVAEESSSKSYKLIEEMSSIGTIVFFITLLIPFVYPDVSLWKLFHLDFDLTDTFIVRENYRNSTVTYIAYVLNLLSMPFFYVYLGRKAKSVWFSMALLAIAFYLSIAMTGYIGRSGMIKILLLIVIILVEKIFDSPKIIQSIKSKYAISDGKTIAQRRKAKVYFLGVVSVLLVLVLLLPWMADFTYTRRNVVSPLQDVSSKIDDIIKVELEFPSLWSKCVEYSGQSNWQRFWLWSLTLPSPASDQLFGTKMSINYEFSERYLGIPYSQEGYFVKLISLPGEGLYLYGSSFYWIHALLTGILIGVLLAFVLRHPTLKYWGIYLGIELVLMARGGIQGALIVIVKQSILLWGIIAFEMIRSRLMVKRGKK